MQPAELRPRYRKHLARGIELHRARAKRDHADTTVADIIAGGYPYDQWAGHFYQAMTPRPFMYAIYHGPDGLKLIAEKVQRSAAMLAAGLHQLGWNVAQKNFFDTITVDVDNRQDDILRRATENGTNLRRITGEGGTRRIGISCDETTTPTILEAVWRSFGAFNETRPPAETSFTTVSKLAADALPASLRRESSFLTHPVFHRYHSETEMLRYMR